jgi:hypothetical protein
MLAIWVVFTVVNEAREPTPRGDATIEVASLP